MKYTLKELLDNHIASDDDVFARIAVYPFSLPLSWVILNFTSLSANTITLTGLSLGIAGCVATVVTQQLLWLGVGFCLFFVCDFVDGQVASVRGSTQLGAMIDTITDHSIMMLVVFCLGLIHAASGHSLELLLLLLYFGLSTYVDLVLFAKHRAASHHATTAGPHMPSSHRRQRGTYTSLWIMFPTRLSSPLVFMVTYALTGSFASAYSAAIWWVLAEYVKLALKLGIMVCNRLKNHSSHGRGKVGKFRTA